VRLRSDWFGQVRLCLLAFMALGVSLTAGAQVQEYYVATNGSDSNNGSQAHPWLTIAHADSALVAGASGTVVHVAAGTYNTGGFTTRKSGTGSNAKVRFQCDVDKACKLNWTGGGYWLLVGSWSQVVNFEMAGNGSGSTAVNIQGSHTDVIGNYMHDFTGGGCQFAGAILENGNAGATIGGTISGNKIVNIGPTSGCNVMHGIYSTFIGTQITNNLIGRISAFGIHSHGFGCQSVISNNTVFNAGKGGIIVSLGTPNAGCNTVDNVTVTNNIVVHSGGGNPGGAGGISFGGNLSGSSCASSGVGTHILLSNNLTYANVGGNYNLCTGAGYSPTTVSGSDSTVFVNYQANGLGDYHLVPSSPANSAGTAQCASGVSRCLPTIDLAGVPRRSPSSLGVYEGRLGDVNLAAPTGLTAVVQ
jgi:hypothetical protein